MTNKAAADLARRRWKGIPKKQRSAMVPRNGGRPRTYPPCPKYGSHRFAVHADGIDRCPCGQTRKPA
jgi:hypothetical protein